MKEFYTIFSTEVFNKPIIIKIIITWLIAGWLFKSMMKLPVTHKVRKRYYKFLQVFGLDDFMDLGSLIFFLGFLSPLFFSLLIIVVCSLLNFSLNLNLNIYTTTRLLANDIVSITLPFALSTCIGVIKYRKKIKSLKRNRLRSLGSSLGWLRQISTQRIKENDIEIKRINRVLTENENFSENAQIKLSEEITDYELKTVKYKKALNDIIPLEERIKSYQSWEQWMYEKIQGHLDESQKQQLAERYDERNLNNLGFIDMILESYNGGGMIKNYRDGFLRDLRKEHSDFAEFYSSHCHSGGLWLPDIKPIKKELLGLWWFQAP